MSRKSLEVVLDVSKDKNPPLDQRIHLVLWRENSQNFFTSKVSIFVCFAQRSKPVIGFAGFQVIYSLLMFNMRL
jgi:hypothetical protein